MATATLTQLDPSPDPIIQRYKADVDRTLIRENLRKSHEERLLTLIAELEAIREERDSSS